MFLIKKDDCLKPCYEKDREKFDKLTNNKIYKFEQKQARNPLHHRKYWGLCALIYDNSEEFSSSENVSDWLKLKSGLIDYIEVTPDRTVIKPRSISFENMDQDEFSKFWDSIMPAITEKLGCSEQDIKDNLIF